MASKRKSIWRRSKIIELLAQGYNQTEIAQMLQVDDGIISKDMIFLRVKKADKRLCD